MVKRSAAESYQLICEIEGPDVLNERATRRYFQKWSQTYEDKKILVDQRLLKIVP